jgi:hypothetical protein
MLPSVRSSGWKLDVVAALVRSASPDEVSGAEGFGAYGLEEDLVTRLDWVPAWPLHLLVLFAAAMGAYDADGEVVY